MSTWPDWKIRNVVLAAMFLIWAMTGLLQSPADLRWSIPVVGDVLLLLTVAWLFANRAIACAEGDLIDIGVACVSMIAGAVLLTMLPGRYEAWNTISLGLVAVGSFVTIVALLNLGRSFAIFPARRTLITSGLYRWVRHPAYAGEIMIMLGVTCAVNTVSAWLLMSLTLAGMVARIYREEQLLAVDEDHERYVQQVRWRLVPRVW